MKKLLFSITAAVFLFSGAYAQKLVIGEKAPDIRIGEWLNGNAPALGGKAVLIDFFHSSNSQCIANLSTLNDLQKRYGARLHVVVVSREDADKIKPFVEGKGYGFYTGTDDAGKTFNGYGVRYVPFAALIDARGRLVWTGNVSNLPDDIVSKTAR